MGFTIMATRGTAAFFEENQVPATTVKKVSAGRPHVVDAIKNGEIQFIINTGSGDLSNRDGYMIRRAALKFSIPYATTVSGAMAMSRGVTALKQNAFLGKTIQDYHTIGGNTP